MKCRWMLLLLGVNLIYIIIGGVVFSFLEQGNEETVAIDASAAYSTFLENCTCIDPEEFQALVQTLVQAYGSGFVAGPNATAGENNIWSLSNAVFFAMTCVTTIGYGHISPSTSGGRVFFILFAMVGIPLTFVFLAQIGKAIRKMNTKVAKQIHCHRKQEVNNAIETMLLTVCGLTTFFLIPAAIFTCTEDWSFQEGMYFAMTTLSTVGFGDYVAEFGKNDSYLAYVFRVFMVFWILLGLAWFAGMISVLQNAMTDGMSKVDGKTSDDSDPEPAAYNVSLTTHVGMGKPLDPIRDANGIILTAYAPRARLEHA